MDGWYEIKSSATACTRTENFLKAASIVIQKPHVLYRNLCGASLLVHDKPFRLVSLKSFIGKFLEWRCKNSERFSTLSVLDTCLGEKISEELQQLDVTPDEDGNSGAWRLTIRLVLPKQTKKFKKLLEVVLSSGETGEVLFIPIMTTSEDVCESCDDQAFCLSHIKPDERPEDKRYSIKILAEGRTKSHPYHSEKWLADVLLPKIIRWSEEENLSTGTSSIALISLERYNQVYQEMKEKYGKKLVDVWPERTDPQKFVYEEVAIASYLLVLFEEEREHKNLTNKQSFIDLGCGNGLLVYVLANEGHPGKGIDLRKRKIWDMYGPEVILEEGSITPSKDTLYTETDWLIGNHSDELTPWIPVIAARSSYRCSYFVLPCCSHDFNSKFNDRRKGYSQYQSYLDYVKEVGQKCGFDVQRDMLRIPSTKRTCFVGSERTYDQEDEEKIDEERTSFINERCTRGRGKTLESDENSMKVSFGEQCSEHGANSDNLIVHSQNVSPGITYSQEKEPESESRLRACDRDSGRTDSDRNGHPAELGKRKIDQDSPFNDAKLGRSDEMFAANVESSTTSSSNVVHSGKVGWAGNFQPREQVEKVRNCTGLSRDVQSKIVDRVFKAVLEAENKTDVVTADERRWNRGGSIPLGDVAKLFDKDTLKQLKNECGGLQTLLRNNHQIFMVVGGKVYLRFEDGSTPARKDTKTKKDNADYTKTKLCWFYGNHPDGCPMETKDCMFAHGQEDMQVALKDR